MLITFFSGLTNSALSALMAPLSALHARADSARMLEIVYMATRITLIVNFTLTAVIFLWGGSMLRAWVGPVYAASVLPILKILALAQTLRLAFAPHSVMLISIGEQNKNVVAPLCESAVNICASVLGIILLGPIGVAWGTLAGAFCRALWVVLRTMPSVGEVRVIFREFMIHAVLPGSIPCLPLVILSFLNGHLTPLAYGIGLASCVSVAALFGGRSIRQSFKQLAFRRIL